MQSLDLLGSLAAAQLQTLGYFLHHLLGVVIANRLAEEGLGVFLVSLIEGRAAVEMLPKRAVAIVLQVFEHRAYLPQGSCEEKNVVCETEVGELGIHKAHIIFSDE